jgi:glycosyltransferase involved in cell wall biosynthesis
MALFACPNPRKYEVCIAEGPWAGVAAIIIKKMGIVKRVVYEDLDFFPAYTFSILKSNFSYHLTYWIEKNAVKRADLVISVGSLLAELRKHQGAKEVHVLSNGYDKRFLDITPDIRSKTIVYAGALANWSGVDKLIEGFRIASTVIPDLQLIIAGDGTEIDTLKNLVKSYGLSEKIKFLGKIPYEDIGHILAKASVGAVIFAPSELTKYAVMCKMMDYLGVGLPILAIDFGETGTFVRNERVGLCVKYDSLSIGENLIRLFKNQRLLIEFHKNAKMAAKGKDWDTILKKEEQLIINLLNFNDK